MVRSCPTRAFSSVDLPTFGRPMIATLMRLGCSAASSSARMKFLCDVVEQVANPRRCSAETGNRSFKAELVELLRQDFALRRVDLVDRERNRLAELAQHCRKLPVGRGKFAAAIDQKNDVCGGFERNSRLLEDLARDEVWIISDNTAGVDQLETARRDAWLRRRCGRA